MAEPITEEQLWGTLEKAETACTLMVNGLCPAGCEECVKFAEENRLIGVRDD